jgi:alkylhydroperoxidase family enzyme
MPTLSLVPAEVVEAWDDAETRWFYREAHRLTVPAATSLSIESHYPAGMVAFCRLWWAAFYEGRIERSLVEELRVRIAEQSGCPYCATSRLDLPPPVAGVTGDPVADARRETALAFTDILAIRPWELGPDAWAPLRNVFDADEVVELAGFAAWQYSGPRMLRSWGAARFKPGERAEAATLPVRLAYDQPVSGALGPRPRPRQDDADRPASAPADWLAFLAPRPDLAAAWTEVWRVAIDDGPLPARIGQLIRVDLAARLAHPGWASADDPAIRAVGVDATTRAALPALDPDLFDPRERAALGYTRALLADRDPDEAEEAALAEAFDEAELVQLGLAVAVQIGAILVDRSRTVRAPGPIALLSGAGG